MSFDFIVIWVLSSPPHTNFRSLHSIYLKNVRGILIGIALNLQIALDSMTILTLILPVHEHGISFPWFVSHSITSLISYNFQYTFLPSPSLICWFLKRVKYNPGVDSHSLFQGIFSTQGLNSDLLYCRQILYPLSYQGSKIYKHCQS